MSARWFVHQKQAADPRASSLAALAPEQAGGGLVSLLAEAEDHFQQQQQQQGGGPQEQVLSHVCAAMVAIASGENGDPFCFFADTLSLFIS